MDGEVEFDREVMRGLLDATFKLDERQRERAVSYGKQMFTFFSEKGFPPDMFLDKIIATKEERVLIVNEYLYRSLEHKRKAGITEKRVWEVRNQNIRKMHEFLKTNEMGIY